MTQPICFFKTCCTVQGPKHCLWSISVVKHIMTTSYPPMYTSHRSADYQPWSADYQPWSDSDTEASKAIYTGSTEWHLWTLNNMRTCMPHGDTCSLRTRLTRSRSANLRYVSDVVWTEVESLESVSVQVHIRRYVQQVLVRVIERVHRSLSCEQTAEHYHSAQWQDLSVAKAIKLAMAATATRCSSCRQKQT